MNTLSIAHAIAQLQETPLMQQQAPISITHQQQQQQPPQAQLVPLNHLQQNGAGTEMSDDVATMPKELILISLISQEHAIFNPKHEHYRSTQRKDIKWAKIANQIGWTDVQCKSKWKALRDQYCRELKRSKHNANASVKWKYFKELDFLRPFALSRNYRSRIAQTTKNDHVNIMNNSAPMVQTNSEYSVAPASLSSQSFTNGNNSVGSNNPSTNHKMETGIVATCGYTTAPHLDPEIQQIKQESGTRFNGEQVNNIVPQDNWNYISTDNVTNVMTTARCSVQPQQVTTMTDEALYNAIVELQQTQQTQHTQPQETQNQQQSQQQQLNVDEEDDDPIHTFLNIESYFEKELINLIRQEEILYNHDNQNYRNVKLKIEVWEEIARKLKKNVKQCRQKWKALRDQYIRECKRIRYRQDTDTMPRWKHYDALSFLQKYIRQKSPSDIDNLNQLLELPKLEPKTDINAPLGHSTPYSRSPVQEEMPMLNLTTKEQSENDMQDTRHLSSTNQSSNLNNINETGGAGLCVSAAYDMDMEEYINGDGAEHQNNSEDVEMTECVREQIEQKLIDYDVETKNTIINSEIAAQNGVTPPVQQHSPTTNTNQQQNHLKQISLSNNIEDEVDAFCKSIAMKIRNANLSPIMLTDLQIGMLRLINETMRKK